VSQPKVGDIDIIILSFAKNDAFKKLTIETIESLIASTQGFLINIIVIESNPLLKNYQYPNSKTIYPKTKFGYNKYINIGLEHTKAPLICVANNDLIFNKGWLKEIVNAFNENKNIKSISPICPKNHIKYGIKPNTGMYEGYRTAIELAGWCLILKREILVLNPFDSHLKFWYCDNDYGKILEMNKMTHVLLTSAIVEHLESVTLKSESEAKQKKLTYREFLYFDYKWNHQNLLKYNYRKLRFDYPIFENVSNYLVSFLK
jgi:GT2 family glycosyltransferase